jgi:hypothetical protein
MRCLSPVGLDLFFKQLFAHCLNRDYVLLCELFTKFCDRVQGHSFPYLPQWFSDYRIPKTLIQRMRTCDDSNTLIETLKFMTILTAEHNEYSRDLMSAGVDDFLAQIHREVKSLDCGCFTLACVSNIGASCQAYRDKLLPRFPVASLISSDTNHPHMLSEVLHVCYSFSGWRFPIVESFGLLAEGLVALAPLIHRKQRKLFLFTLSNLADTVWSDHFFNVPPVSTLLIDVLFSETDPDLLRPLLWTLPFIYERNVITGNEIVQRILFLISFQSEISALACEVLGIIIRVSHEFIDVDLRPGIGRIVLDAANDHPMVTRKAALNTLYIFAYFFTEYVPFLIDHDLLPSLMNTIEIDDSVMQIQGLLLLDCIFGIQNASGHTYARDHFAAIGGMSVIESLLDSDIPELVEPAELFLLTWDGVLEL